MVLNEQTQQQIAQEAESIAKARAREIPPDPLKPLEYLIRSIKTEVDHELTEHLTSFSNGMTEIHATLSQSNNQESLNELEKLQKGLDLVADNLSHSPMEASGISEEAMKAFTQVALNLFENKEYEKAGQVYFFLAFLDPAEKAYPMGIATTDYFTYRYEEGIKNYQRVIEIDNQDFSCYLYMAHCYLELKEIDKALECTDQALKLLEQIPEQKVSLDTAQALKDHLLEQKE